MYQPCAPESGQIYWHHYFGTYKLYMTSHSIQREPALVMLGGASHSAQHWAGWLADAKEIILREPGLVISQHIQCSIYTIFTSLSPLSSQPVSCCLALELPTVGDIFRNHRRRWATPKQTMACWQAIVSPIWH